MGEQQIDGGRADGFRRRRGAGGKQYVGTVGQQRERFFERI